MNLFDQAAVCFQKCIDINPNESAFYFNKARSHISLEQYDLSISLLDKAIELNSNDALCPFGLFPMPM